MEKKILKLRRYAKKKNLKILSLELTKEQIKEIKKSMHFVFPKEYSHWNESIKGEIGTIYGIKILRKLKQITHKPWLI